MEENPIRFPEFQAMLEWDRDIYAQPIEDPDYGLLDPPKLVGVVSFQYNGEPLKCEIWGNTVEELKSQAISVLLFYRNHRKIEFFEAMKELPGVIIGDDLPEPPMSLYQKAKRWKLIREFWEKFKKTLSNR